VDQSAVGVLLSRSGARKVIRLLSAEEGAEFDVDYNILVGGGGDLAEHVQSQLAGLGAENFADSFNSILEALDPSAAGSFAVEAVTNSATPPIIELPVTPISAKGDPHLVNMYGQRFDIMQPGNHTMIVIPRMAAAESTLLRVVALAEHHGRLCADMYITVLTITGKWAEETHGLHYNSPGIWYSAMDFASHQGNSTSWNKYGSINLKVTWGRTTSGVDYLNILVRDLNRAKYSVGGLLGEDDHTGVSTPKARCKRTMSV
jgi:hypothetical protein